MRNRAAGLAALLVLGACATATQAEQGAADRTASTVPAIGLTPRGLEVDDTPDTSAPTTTSPATTTDPPTTVRRRPSTTAPGTAPPVTAVPLPVGTPVTTVPIPTNPRPMPPVQVPAVLDPVVRPDPLLARSTACSTVFHIGDSLTVGTMTNVPASQRQDAQYARVGVTYPRIDALGGRTIHEFRVGVSTAVEAASLIREQSGHGCWVFAIGTNDAANISIGSDVKARERIDRMMEIAGTDPVLWVNAVTITNQGAWASVNMRLWDIALLDAAPRYPNMRILDVASDVRADEFLTDGIHYTAAGYARRARLIADALATAFPA